jgi:hypothetical protein
VVLALDKTGLWGLDSYGPPMVLDRAMVTMWFTPVPPGHVRLVREDVGRERVLTFGRQQIVPSVFPVDVRSFGSLSWSVKQARLKQNGKKAHHAAGSIPYDAPLAHSTRVKIHLGLLNVRSAIGISQQAESGRPTTTYPTCQAWAPVMYVLPSTSQKGSVS